jgi:hypothetical protein
MADTIGRKDYDEARELVLDGVARDIDEAQRRIAKEAAMRRLATTTIFYPNSQTDIALVRYVLVLNHGGCVSSGLVDEKYYGEFARTARICPGILAKIKKYNASKPARYIADGRLMELESKETGEVQIAAEVRNIGYDGKSGIFLGSENPDAVYARGKQTYDETHNLYRLQFQPYEGDYVLGMVDAWTRHPVNDAAVLVLHLDNSKISVKCSRD